jgi:acyl-CoA synthetase (AMP-forming)/AMP-acid ligase II
VDPVDVLAIHASINPTKPAIIEGERTIDFDTLNRRANKAANVMLAVGCGLHDRVASMGFNSAALFEVSHGLRKAGLVGTPINYRLRGAEVAYVLNDSGAAVVLADDDHVDVVEAARPEVRGEVRYLAMGARRPAGWLAYEELMESASETAPPAPGEVTGLAPSMIYTSGTTGHPKGTWRPNGVNVENVMQMISIFGLTDSDVHLMCGPGYHSAVSFFSALHHLVGATIVVQPKFEAATALDLIERHGVTTAFMAPTLLHRLLDAEEAAGRAQGAARDHTSLRSIFLGAAPCPYPLKVRGEALLGQVLWEFYGATETGINTVLRPEDQLRKPGSCGQAVPGQEIRLVDSEGKDVQEGEPGEFLVRNSWLAEYYNKPDATQGSLHDGFFTVGDIAYRDAEGYYFICDRRIDMIISGGVNIYPAEIEAVLLAHPAVADAAVVGVPDEQWGESVKAVVQLRESAKTSAEELIAFSAERLAGYKKPRSIDFVAQLPRDAAGKLLKRAIRERYWAGTGRRI